jgi:hypothetical protein
MRAASDTGLTGCAADSAGVVPTAGGGWASVAGRADGDLGEVGCGLAVVAQVAGEGTVAQRL